MKAITVTELLERAQAYASDCSDGKANSQDLRFNSHGCVIYPVNKDGVNIQGTPNDHAFSQIVERLDAPPVSWIGNVKRCPLELRAKILNNLAANYRPNSGLFLRHKGDTVRAVLSDQYRPFDNANFIDLVGQAVETLGTEAQVHRPVVGDELSAYILLPAITFAPDPSNKSGNGGLHPAIYIRNSEIGTGSARTAGGMYQSACSNGTIYGYKSEETLSVRHRWLSVGTMRAVIASGIAEALKMSEECALSYVSAQEIYIEQVSLSGIVNSWANKYGLSIPAKENWLKYVPVEADHQNHDGIRVSDLVNAATFTAQTVENVQAREMQERMAGDLLAAFTQRATRNFEE